MSLSGFFQQKVKDWKLQKTSREGGAIRGLRENNRICIASHNIKAVTDIYFAPNSTQYGDPPLESPSTSVLINLKHF